MISWIVSLFKKSKKIEVELSTFNYKYFKVFRDVNYGLGGKRWAYFRVAFIDNYPISYIPDGDLYQVTKEEYDKNAKL